MREIRPLTALRGLAALLVFMYHYAYLFPGPVSGVAGDGRGIPLLPIWRQGQVGVSVFFVLSGFLITRIYFDGFVARRVPLRLYVVKRIARIWPLFLTFALIQHVGFLLRGTHLDATALVTFSLTQGFFAELRNAGLPTAWSLTIEESFYLAAPVIFWLLWRVGGVGRAGDRAGAPRELPRVILVVGGVVVGLLLAGDILRRVAAAAGLQWQGFLASRYLLLHSTLFGRFPEFGIGMVAAFLHRRGRLLQAWGGSRATVWSLGAFLAIGLAIWGKDAVARGALSSSPAASLAISLVIAVLAGWLILVLTVQGSWTYTVLSWEPLVRLGRYSYGLYLIQLTVLIAPLVRISDHCGKWRLPVLFLLANMVCGLMYHRLEVPCRRWIVDRWGKGREPGTG